VSFAESEISALLNAHDALVTAYADSSLRFDEFVFACDEYPRNSGLVGTLGRRKDRVALRLWVGVLSGLPMWHCCYNLSAAQVQLEGVSEHGET
jgi:hypothetical protein